MLQSHDSCSNHSDELDGDLSELNETLSDPEPDADPEDARDERQYEKLLRQKHENKQISTTSDPNFEAICASFSPKRIKVKEDILAYWRNQRQSLPDLYRVAEVIFAIPANQVSVERLFSQLKLVLSDNRYNLKNKNVNEILFIKSNFDTFENLKRLSMLN